LDDTIRAVLKVVEEESTAFRNKDGEAKAR
jgi:hypothetical protein